ncbi:MAG: hypothetical protein KDK66_02305 [Deltaproteobacteria bacterium]|nr:hypothetical protein [Deltaproteobacteria bacterium]
MIPLKRLIKNKTILTLNLAVILSLSACGGSDESAAGEEIVQSFCHHITTCNSNISSEACTQVAGSHEGLARDLSGTIEDFTLNEVEEKIKEGLIALDQEALDNCLQAIEEIPCEEINTKIQDENDLNNIDEALPENSDACEDNVFINSPQEQK